MDGNDKGDPGPRAVMDPGMSGADRARHKEEDTDGTLRPSRMGHQSKWAGWRSVLYSSGDRKPGEWLELGSHLVSFNRGYSKAGLAQRR